MDDVTFGRSGPGGPTYYHYSGVGRSLMSMNGLFMNEILSERVNENIFRNSVAFTCDIECLLHDMTL